MPLRTERRPGRRLGYLTQVVVLSPERLDRCRRSPEELDRLLAFEGVPDDDRIELSSAVYAVSLLATNPAHRDAFRLVLESTHRTGAPGVIRLEHTSEHPAYALLPERVTGCALALQDVDADAMIARIPDASRSMNVLGGLGEPRLRWLIAVVLDVVREADARGAALASWRSFDDTVL
jgi:hypothetical protein